MHMAKKTIIRAAAVTAVAALGLFASPAHGDRVNIGIGINIGAPPPPPPVVVEERAVVSFDTYVVG